MVFGQRMRRAVVWCGLLLGGVGLSVQGTEPPPASAPEPLAVAAPEPAAGGNQLELPGNVRIRAGRFTEAPQEIRFFDLVDIDSGEAKIQADTVVYQKDSGMVVATGNVTLTFTGAFLSGSRLVYRLSEQTGDIEDVVGYLDQDNAIFRAKKARRTAPEWIEVEDALFTTCSQPTPYWSFRIRRGKFHLGNYAYLKGVSFKARRVPVFWSPYLVWPIKTDRAMGLLIPEFRNSTKLGTSISIPLYLPIAPNADLTVKFDAHTKVGVGLDTELDWLPTWQGRAKGRVFWINDQVRHRNRYRVTWHQTQQYRRDWLLTANVEQVSDFDYFSDYETDLNRAATPITFSTIDITRSVNWLSVSLRARRQNQFFVGGSDFNHLLTQKVVNTIFPQLEFRGRSQRIGKSPIFLSFESSLAGFGKDILGPPDDSPGGVGQEGDLVTRYRNRWGRIDLAPQLQMPLFKSAWADMTVFAGWRGTWYSGRPDPADANRIITKSVFRNLYSAGFTLLGPRLQRVFLTPNGRMTPKIKHVIEPFLDYRWRPSAGTPSSEIPLFDEIDAVPGEMSDFNYGIRQRFIALKRPQAGRAQGIATVSEVSFEGLARQEKENQERVQKDQAQPGGEGKLEVVEALNPVEFASIDLFQSYSFKRFLSRAYRIDPATGKPWKDPATGLPGLPRHYSPITLRFRLNPTSEQLVDASYQFDPANSVLTETSVSATSQVSQRLYLEGRWYRRRPVEPTYGQVTNFVRARWGLVSSNGRLALETDWDWNLKRSKLEHQGYSVRWTTQCCAFRFGIDQREFVGNERREFTLAIDLSGIGEIIKFKSTQ